MPEHSHVLQTLREGEIVSSLSICERAACCEDPQSEADLPTSEQYRQCEQALDELVAAGLLRRVDLCGLNGYALS